MEIGSEIAGWKRSSGMGQGRYLWEVMGLDGTNFMGYVWGQG